MHYWNKLLLFVGLVLYFGIVSVNGQFLKRTELHIYRIEYINVLYGSEMKPIKLRLNFESNDTYIHNIPIGESQTFRRNSDGVTGSELFKIGKYTLRFPVKWGSSPQRDERVIQSGPPFQGSIGMAKRGVFWRYWTNYTLGPSTLILGGREPYLQEDPEFYGPPISISSGCTSWKYKIDIHGAGAYTLVPPELYGIKEFEMVIKTHDESECEELYKKMGINPKKGSCHNELIHKIGERDHMMKSPNNFEYRMVLPNVDNPNQILLGRYATSGMVIYMDFMNDIHTIAPAYRIYGEESNLYETGESRIFDMSLIGIGIVLISMMCMLAILGTEYEWSDKKNIAIKHIFLSGMRFCLNGFFWIFIFFHFSRYGDGIRFIVRTTRSSYGNLIGTTYMIILVIAWVICAIFIPRGSSFTHLFRPALESIVAFSMWASILFTHDEDGTLELLFLLETFAAIPSLVRTYSALVHGEYDHAIYFSLFWVWHIFVAISIPLLHLIRRDWENISFGISFIILYVAAVIGISGIIAAKSEMSLLERSKRNGN